MSRISEMFEPCGESWLEFRHTGKATSQTLGTSGISRISQILQMSQTPQISRIGETIVPYRKSWFSLCIYFNVHGSHLHDLFREFLVQTLYKYTVRTCTMCSAKFLFNRYTNTTFLLERLVPLRFCSSAFPARLQSSFTTTICSARVLCDNVFFLQVKLRAHLFCAPCSHFVRDAVF